MERISRIGHKLHGNGGFSDADRRYVESQIRSGDFVVAMPGALVLAMATKKHLYPKEALFQELRSLERSSGPDQAAAYLSCAAGLCEGESGPPLGTTLSAYEKLAGDPRNPSRLTDAEKQFVERAFASKRLADEVRAAQVLVRKRGLPEEDLEWALPFLVRSRSSASKSNQSFWGFVEQVVQDRSPRGSP